ncbi:MAG: hypothetical protein PHR35_02050 [Kiritimatiellae bacterium]|nr:hypothetical protein [Kiritimatiellia bacterium]
MSAHAYPRRYPGKRWEILFGDYSGVEQFAVNEAQRYIQAYLPYVPGVAGAAAQSQAGMDSAEHLLVLGTRESNPLIAQLIDGGILRAPEGAEGYSAICTQSPWGANNRLVAIAGNDARGVLYGVERFGLTLLPELAAPLRPSSARQSLDELPPFSRCERPAVANRGIWTWGYVVCDYRAFVDGMARLRLNTLTIWNDVPSLNCRDIIAHAHNRGIKVILGFEWGWGHDDRDITNPADRAAIRRTVLQVFARDYAGLGMDGICCQTVTEHSDKDKGGVSVATAATALINETAGELLASYPGLTIQFGLHATSIGDRFAELSALDPRVTIVWEDAGDIPFRYSLSPHVPSCYACKHPEAWVASPEATIDYSRKLAAVRGGRDEFAIVPKGWICLDWSSEFEHHGPFIMGERDAATIRARAAGMHRHWLRTNALWMEHYGAAARYYRELLASHQGPMTVTALIEDGLIEMEIQPSVALFAETVWNPNRADGDILRNASLLAATANEKAVLHR